MLQSLGEESPVSHVLAFGWDGSADDQIWHVWKNQNIRFPNSDNPVLAISEYEHDKS
jgi:hypothetical protein